MYPPASALHHNIVPALRLFFATIKTKKNTMKDGERILSTTIWNWFLCLDISLVRECDLNLKRYMYKYYYIIDLYSAKPTRLSVL